MTFKRPAINRQLSFEEISQEARLPVSEVELLVMRALSLGLVKGSIDQMEQKAHMTWVQPRVLNREQVCATLNLVHISRQHHYERGQNLAKMLIFISDDHLISCCLSRLICIDKFITSQFSGRSLQNSF